MRWTTFASGAAAALVWLLLAAVPADAEYGWNAEWLGQSEYPTLESGQRTTSFFRAKNVGDRTWEQTFVNLGATNPRDRHSALHDPETWLNPGRAGRLKEIYVVPGGTGTFEFTVRAPDVTERTTFREHFAPVADRNPPEGGWMEESFRGAYLDYTVTPRKAPTVRLAGYPQTVRAGDRIDVVAEAADDYAMRHVKFLLDGNEAATSDSGSDGRYAASIDAPQITPGTHQLTARAIDHVGNETDVSVSFEVYAPPPPEPPRPQQPPRIDADATLEAELLGRSRVRLLELVVTAPKGSRIAVRCRPRRCRPQVVRSTRRRTTRLRRLRGKVLRRGAKVTVAITKPGFRGTAVQFTVAPRTVRKTRQALAR